jgi:hypothetical protein
LALREEYEQTTPPLDLPSEPKEGQELKTGRFPKIVSYLLGALAVVMLAAAVFLFSIPDGHKAGVADPVVADVGVSGETAVPDNTDLIVPTPPLLAAPPLPPDAIPTPPMPTPWPTPPIAPDSPADG